MGGGQLVLYPVNPRSVFPHSAVAAAMRPDAAEADLKFADYPKVKNISIPTQREIEAFWY